MPDRRPPRELTDDDEWLSAAGVEDRTGSRVVLEGGPLDGRTAHLRDSSYRLWVAIGNGDTVVRSARDRPSEATAVDLIGWYEFDQEDETLRWHPE